MEKKYFKITTSFTRKEDRELIDEVTEKLGEKNMNAAIIRCFKLMKMVLESNATGGKLIIRGDSGDSEIKLM